MLRSKMALAQKSKQPATAHHRKRVGQHHKQTKRYSKTYWPYLPLILIVALGITVNSIWASVGHGVLGYATDVNVSALLQGTNSQRTGSGEAGLSINSLLSAAAQAKANDMANRDYWSHTTPDGAAPWSFIAQAGYSYQAAGENLAYGFNTSSEVIAGWMNSAEHRANILNNNYAEVGFGVANATNYQGTGPETIVVAMYGKPAAVAPAPKPVAAIPTPSKAVTTPPPAAAAPVVEAPAPAVPAPTPAQSGEPTKPAPAATKEVGATGSKKPLPEKQVSRIQLVSNGTAPWSAFAVSSIAIVALAIFFLKHGLMWRRIILKGEKVMVRYHLLDIVLVSLGIIGFILTRGAGTIH
jgi:uncharacterized protein YkwD